MIDLPDFNKAFEYENNFYLSCSSARIAKMIAHYKLYNMVMDMPGHIVECGVFKGASLCRFAMFKELFSKDSSKKVIGFDTFCDFPETKYADDIKPREAFVKTAGIQSISNEQLTDVLTQKGLNDSVELVKGDITKTVPLYLEKNPDLKISLLNLDVDIYEPSVVVLECLYPRIVKGGLLILDDYKTFPGETKAVDEYFKNKKVQIQKFDFSNTPYYVVKE